MDDDDIWNKNRDELIRYASLLTGPDEAEDLLSTVVARSIARQPLRDLDNPKAYLYRALRNEACSVSRRRSREKKRQTSLNQTGGREEYNVSVQFDVVAAVQQLPEKQRTAAYFYYWRDLSVRETAALMGCREGSVKRYLFDARKNLKELLR